MDSDIHMQAALRLRKAKSLTPALLKWQSNETKSRKRSNKSRYYTRSFLAMILLSPRKTAMHAGPKK